MVDHSYRLYMLCEQGLIRGAINRMFMDDRLALDHGRALLEHHDGVEVWQSDRLIGVLERRDRAGRLRAS